MANDSPMLAVRSITPPVALDIGYSLYLADAAAEGSALKESAREAMRKFDALEAQFSEESAEWSFFLAIRVALNSLARGIARRKHTLEDRLRTAADEKTNMIKRFTETQRAVGFLRGGARLLLVGGFGFTLMMAIFASDAFRDHKVADQPSLYSITFAFALALVGSFLMSWQSERRQIAISTRYEGAIQRANREYAESARAEYEILWKNTSIAWRNLTGEEPPEFIGFDLVFARMIDGDHTLNHRPPQTAVIRPLREMIREKGKAILRGIKGK